MNQDIFTLQCDSDKELLKLRLERINEDISTMAFILADMLLGETKDFDEQKYITLSGEFTEARKERTQYEAALRFNANIKEAGYENYCKISFVTTNMYLISTARASAN